MNYNKDESNATTIPLSNLILFDPLVDTPTERLNQLVLPYAIGLYDDFQIDQTETLLRKCEEAPSRGFSPDEQSTACKNVLNYANDDMTGNVYQMDSRYFDSEIDPIFSPFRNMFKRRRGCGGDRGGSPHSATRGCREGGTAPL